MVQMKWSQKGKDRVKSMTVMKKGTNTKMKYQQGQTRLSSQYAKRAASKFTLRTYISLLPYQEADHITFEAGLEVAGGCGGLVISGQQEYIFFCKPAGQDIFSLLICLQDFFFLKRVSPGFDKNVFTLWLLQ